jgi:hypothetical protein
MWIKKSTLLAFSMSVSLAAMSALPTITAAADSNGAMPTYKPFVSGAPKTRVGGGSRGSRGLNRGSRGSRGNRGGESWLSLNVLAPLHTGYTVTPQPTLYWSVSEIVDEPFKFTLVYSDFTRGTEPLVDTEIPKPTTGGIYAVNLADYKVTLEPEVEYQWSLSIVMDPTQQAASKDIVSSGTIKLAPKTLSQNVNSKIARVQESQKPFIYAQEGMWFDAIAWLNQQLKKNPNDQQLQQQRATLLEQVDLMLEKINGIDVVVEKTLAETPPTS